MKSKWIWPLILCFQGAIAMAQVGINQDGSLPDSSALLDVKSFNKGFLPPRMTYMQMISIPSPAEGLMVYDLTHHQPAYFNGNNWTSLRGDTLSLTPGMPMDGGIISYVDSSGVRGFIAAETDQSVNCEFGTFIECGPQRFEVGTGHLNTWENTFIAHTSNFDSSNANRICQFLNLNGYSDWFLPSAGELQILFQNLKINNLGNFADAEYWSSTSYQEIYDIRKACFRDFLSGHDDCTDPYTRFRARAIRSFGPYGKPEAISLKAVIHSDSTTLNAKTNANGYATQVNFEFGLTTSYGNMIPADIPILSGHSDWPMQARVGGLTPGNTYHYRVVASNQAGTTYGEDQTFVAFFGLGETYAGGIIVYIDSSWVHGLVCTDSVFESFEWGCNGTDLPGADNEGIGGGLQNTLDIIASCNTPGIPATICYNLVLNDLDDWFLPSAREVDCIFDLLYDPYFLHNLYSSTEIDATEVYARFWDGGYYFPILSAPKYPYYLGPACHFRAVRKY